MCNEKSKKNLFPLHHVLLDDKAVKCWETEVLSKLCKINETDLEVIQFVKNKEMFD